MEWGNTRTAGFTKEEARRNILKLSGGQQQRVAVARALISAASELTDILRESAH